MAKDANNAWGEPETSKHPFLKVDELPKRGKLKVTLTGEVSLNDGKFGPQFFFTIKHSGKLKTLRVKENSANHQRIWEAHGKAIAGKTVEVMRAEHMGKEYIQVQ